MQTNLSIFNGFHASLILARFLLFYRDAMMQKTLKDIISFSGIGLHTGYDVKVRILPAQEDAGISFVRKDIPGSAPIKAKAGNVVCTSYATSIGVKGVAVSTVEHLMAAFYGLGVDNAIVEMDGPEVPIMDGSAAYFIERMEAAGLAALCAPRRYLVVKRPIKVSDHDKYVLLMPSEDMEFTIDYSIDFSHPFLSKQSFSGLFSKDVFTREVSSARTFGFLSDVETMRANGLARGGSLNNAIVISDTEILNEGGLRYPDEFVRHKVLDMMGDLSFVGAPVIGRLMAHRSGHTLNQRLVEKIIKSPENWCMTDGFSSRLSHEPGHGMMDEAAAF